MKELPNPTFALSPIAMLRGSLHQSRHAVGPALVQGPAVGKISVSWARNQDEIRQAQRAGSTYSETEFDLIRLRFLRARMVELGRSCVHAEHRHGGVILALWGALAEFMSRNRFDTMIGCASIPMQHNGVSGGHAAASIWRQVRQTHLAAIEYRVTPRLALPVEQLDDSLDVEPPALIKGYLRLGAKVLGAPAWDPDFNAADLPMMMRVNDLPPRYFRHFSGKPLAGSAVQS